MNKILSFVAIGVLILSMTLILLSTPASRLKQGTLENFTKVNLDVGESIEEPIFIRNLGIRRSGWFWFQTKEVKLQIFSSAWEGESSRYKPLLLAEGDAISFHDAKTGDLVYRVEVLLIFENGTVVLGIWEGG